MLIAVAVPLGLTASLALSSTAFARAVSHGAAKGSVACSDVTGQITFTPPLVPGKETSKTETTGITATLGGCKVGSASVTPTSVSIKSIKSKVGNSCSTFESSVSTTKVSEVVDWSGVSPTKINETSVSLGSTGFTATGSASGSYAGSASTTVVISPSNLSNLLSCIGMKGTGVSSLTISSGSANF